MELEEAINNLQEYINLDRKMRTSSIEEWSDFDKFCELHCRDIEKALHYIKEESISRAVVEEKMSWKPISEYDTKKYDWVLIKYFDGDYECVPEVAEKRWDEKWYTTEREIPFEVKYFFDIQELLNEGESDG